MTVYHIIESSLSGEGCKLSIKTLQKLFSLLKIKNHRHENKQSNRNIEKTDFNVMRYFEIKFRFHVIQNEWQKISDTEYRRDF